MWRFFSWMLTLVLLGVFVTSAAIAAGERQPDASPLPALGYDRCDGFPCYLGMVPGLISWTDANERIAGFQQGDTTYQPLKLTRFTMPNAGGFLISNTPDLTLTEVALSPRGYTGEFPTLRDLLLFYGTPCSVYTEQFQTHVTLIRLVYPHLTVDFPHETERLSWDRRPDYINIKRAQDNLCELTEGLQPWRGTTLYWRYRQS